MKKHEEQTRRINLLDQAINLEIIHKKPGWQDRCRGISGTIQGILRDMLDANKWENERRVRTA